MVWEKGFTKFREIKPFVGCSFHSSVVKVKAVYVNVGFHRHPVIKTETASWAVSTLTPKRQGGYVYNYPCFSRECQERYDMSKYRATLGGIP